MPQKLERQKSTTRPIPSKIASVFLQAGLFLLSFSPSIFEFPVFPEPQLPAEKESDTDSEEEKKRKKKKHKHKKKKKKGKKQKKPPSESGKEDKEELSDGIRKSRSPSRTRSLSSVSLSSISSAFSDSFDFAGMNFDPSHEGGFDMVGVRLVACRQRRWLDAMMFSRLWWNTNKWRSRFLPGPFAGGDTIRFLEEGALSGVSLQIVDSVCSHHGEHLDRCFIFSKVSSLHLLSISSCQQYTLCNKCRFGYTILRWNFARNFRRLLFASDWPILTDKRY